MGYRNPSFRELYLYRMANPDLQPERMLNYEFTVSKQFSHYFSADITAYYSRGCDCGDLFAGLEIAEDEHYTEHMNRYNVLFLNMQEFLSQSSDMPEMLALLKKSLLWDMLDSYTVLKYFDKINLTSTMQDIFN